MSRSGSRAALAATAAVMLADAAAARFLFEADERRVYFLGHALTSACGLRERFGVPCPTCGLTRSMVLALHGEAIRAFDIAWGGPFLLALLLAIAVALLIAAFAQRAIKPLARIVAAYGFIAVAVWLAGWIVQVRTALH